jgi:hypothetical protein
MFPSRESGLVVTDSSGSRAPPRCACAGFGRRNSRVRTPCRETSSRTWKTHPVGRRRPCRPASRRGCARSPCRHCEFERAIAPRRKSRPRGTSGGTGTKWKPTRRTVACPERKRSSGPVPAAGNSGRNIQMVSTGVEPTDVLISPAREQATHQRLAGGGLVRLDSDAAPHSDDAVLLTVLSPPRALQALLEAGGVRMRVDLPDAHRVASRSYPRFLKRQ